RLQVSPRQRVGRAKPFGEATSQQIAHTTPLPSPRSRTRTKLNPFKAHRSPPPSDEGLFARAPTPARGPPRDDAVFQREGGIGRRRPRDGGPPRVLLASPGGRHRRDHTRHGERDRRSTTRRTTVALPRPNDRTRRAKFGA